MRLPLCSILLMIIAKWQKAAAAAAVFTENNDRGYSLYPDYRNLFNQNSGAAQNEYIFTRNFTSSNFQQAPANNLGRRYGAYGGWWASNGPTQNLVDDYDMINGEPAFIWSGNTKTINPASGYDPNHPYWNRDPRLKQDHLMIPLFSMAIFLKCGCHLPALNLGMTPGNKAVIILAAATG